MAKRTNKPRPAPDDWHLWREVARSVNPLPKKSPILPVAAESKVGLSGVQTPKTAPTSLAGRFYSPPWSPGTAARGPVPGTVKSTIEPRMHKRLRRGQLPIDARIDLHGLHQDQARRELLAFIQTRAGRGDRTILVITGKGLKKTGYGALAERGVLRHMLPHWLNEPEIKPLIAGWEISARCHGGEGAFYVRLKRLNP